METIRGEVERITYYNEESGYSVIKLLTRVGKNQESLTVVGNFSNLAVGQSLELMGKWQQHARYGRQFHAESYRSLLPSHCEGIKKYLASGLIKGVGPVLAERIVNKFGSETIEVIESQPERLLEVEGIGLLKLKNITTSWMEQKEIRDIIQLLQAYEVPAGYAYKIFKFYGKDSVEIIKNNPYQIAMDISGIGFVTADKIAGKIGISEHSTLRARGAIFFILQKMAGEGHVCYPEEELLYTIQKTIHISKDVLQTALEEMASRKEIIKEKNFFPGNVFIYLPGFYTCEETVSKKLLQLKNTKTLYSPRLEDMDAIIKSVEKKLSFSLDEHQRRALETALFNKVTIITGGPGTGKTTMIKVIVAISELMGRKVLLAAPTGRASKRLEEATKHKASTIHRLLEYSPTLNQSTSTFAKEETSKKKKKKEGGFLRNETNPLKADTIIIDEASMIDIVLLHHLLKAVNARSSIIFVGDADQLPSVGPGNILRDLIECGLFTTIKLSTIHRQARNSHIIINAHRIKEGKMIFVPERGKMKDFYFIPKEDPEEIAPLVVKLCQERIPESFGLRPEEIQVLTPMNRGILGTSNLNRLLQDALNPSGFQMERSGIRFKIGDKVMQIRNNYEKDIFNGDMGKIAFIDLENQEMIVDFYYRKVKYDFSELDDLTLSYAVSIHKAQGSEFPAVVVPITTQHYVMLQRNLLYTAITRGKKLVVLVGSKKALYIGIRNSIIQRRFSLLEERLKRWSKLLTSKEQDRKP